MVFESSGEDPIIPLQVYPSLLETQIETKEDFIRQAQEKVESLRKQKKLKSRAKEVGSVNPEVWNNLQKKALMFPEKSDPIGLSLANTSLSMRAKSSESYISFLKSQYKMLKEANDNQQSINHNLRKLITSFPDRVDSAASNRYRTMLLEEENNELWSNLKSLIKETLFTEPLSDNDDDVDMILGLFKKLLNPDDSPTIGSFRKNSRAKQLFRVLVRADVLSVEDGDRHLSNENSKVSLVDFNADI